MSGSTIGGAIGAGIGFFVGGPSGARWGWMIGSAVGGYVDPQVIEGPKLDNPQQQTGAEGIPRPLLYGRAGLIGNVIMCQSKPTEHVKKERQGKGGPVTKTYTYTRTAAIRIAEAAPLDGEFKLLRAWMNGKLVLDATGTGTIDADSAALLEAIDFYSGSETQMPSATLEALPAVDGGGAGNVPAFRGTCYAVVRDVDVTQTGGALPVFRWEIASCGTVMPGSGGGADTPFTWMIASSTGYLYTSPDPDTWATKFTNANGVNNPTYVTVSGSRIILSNPTSGSSAKYSDDFGATSFATLTGWPATLCAPPLVLPSGRIVLLATHSTAASVYYSDDNGTTWTGPYALGMGATYIKGDDDYIVVANPTNYKMSVNGGVTFGSTVAISGVFINCNALGYRNGIFMFGPANMAANPARRLDAATGTMTSVTFTGSTGQAIDCLGLSDGSWLIAHGTGPLTTTQGVTRSPDGVSAFVGVTTPVIQLNSSEEQRLAALGGVVLLSGGDASGYLKILKSVDFGVTWANVPHGEGATAAAGIGITVVPVVTYTGTELPDAPGYFYDPETATVSGPGIDTVDPCEITLDEVVGDLCDRAGVADYDVTDLADDIVRGYPIIQPTSADGAIRVLQQAYFFDMPEWGNSGDVMTALRAVKRGGTSALSLDEDDLVESDDDTDTRMQAIEFPRKVNVIGSDFSINYEPAKETAERVSENVKALSEITISTPIIFTRSELAQIADKTLRVAWEEAAGESTCTVPEAFTAYVPSDIITRKGRRYRLDMIGAGDGESNWTLKRDRASAYFSSAVGGDALPMPDAESALRGPTFFQALNLPRLRSQDSSPGMYIGVCGGLPGWNGCDLYLSVDGGLTEDKVATIIDPAVMGWLTSGLAVGGSPLAVQLYNDDELDDATPEQLAARMNAAAVTSSDVSEILQFADTTDTGVRTYDLTTLSRGLLTTTEAAHAANDPFIVLDASIYFLPIDISHAGKTLIFRPVSRGTVPANNATYSVVYIPQFTGPEVIEQFTDDAGNVYTDDADNPYYYTAG